MNILHKLLHNEEIECLHDLVVRVSDKKDRELRNSKLETDFPLLKTWICYRNEGFVMLLPIHCVRL